MLVSVIAIGLLTSAQALTTTTPGSTEKPSSQAQDRIDQFEEILRPPPPPPNLLNKFPNGQAHRFQRQQHFPLSQSFLAASKFQHERYPTITEVPPNDGFIQKITNWFFSPENKNPDEFNSPPPVPGPGPGPFQSPPPHPNGPLPFRPPNVDHGPPHVPPPPNFRPRPPHFEQGPPNGPPIAHGPPPPPPSNNRHPGNGPPRPAQILNAEPTLSVPQIRPLSAFKVQQRPQRPLQSVQANQHNNNNNNNEDCHTCNQYPWIPVIRYHSRTPHSGRDQLNLNTNAILSSSSHNNPAIQTPSTFEPTKLSLPLNEPHKDYLPSNSNPGPTSHGPPVRLSEANLQHKVRPNPVRNSYGNPVPPTSHDYPLPVTNDEGSQFNFHGYQGDRDNLQNLESQKVTAVSKLKPGEIATTIGPNQNYNFEQKFNRYPVTNNFDQQRNIQVLQPIPLPNLSAVPLPPIFNSRPFKNNFGFPFNRYNGQDSTVLPSTRPTTNAYHATDDSSHTEHNFISNIISKHNKVRVEPSVPLAEFTSSIDYPITIVESPILDIDASGNEKQVISLNTNPIVVDSDNQTSTRDSFSAASGGNERDNDDVRGQSQFLPTPNTIDGFSHTVNSDNVKPFTPNQIRNSSSIFNHQHVTENTPQNLQSLDSPLLYLRPNTPHKNSIAFKTNIESPDHSSINSISSTPEPSGNNWENNGFRYLENDHVPGRWPPPSTDFNGQPVEPTKKPKRIQIIIPYTSKNNPSPFKFSNSHVSSSGWIPMTESQINARKVPPKTPSELEYDAQTASALVDYHESSESKIVASATPNFNYSRAFEKQKPIVETTTRLSPIYIGKKNRTLFDITKLQKNIDEWTAQEYSKIYKRQHKTSTISHLKRSKKIPDEYFTTMPPPKKSKNPFLSSINEINTSLLDSEPAASVLHSTEADSPRKVKFIVDGDGDDFYSNIIPYDTKTELSFTTKKISKTTTNYEYTTIPPTTTTKQYWEKIPTTISPLTMEKIYVVTPIPINRTDNIRPFNNTRIKEQQILSFKSPRFLVRPTPGPTGSQRDSSVEDTSKKSSFEWLQSINDLEEKHSESSSNLNNFGLRMVTTYSPPDGAAIHTYSGHSKVVTAITQSPIHK